MLPVFPSFFTNLSVSSRISSYTSDVCSTVSSSAPSSTSLVCSGIFATVNILEDFLLFLWIFLWSDLMVEICFTGCKDPRVFPLYTCRGLSCTLIKFTGNFPFCISTGSEPITTPIVSANVGRHSTAQNLFCADFPCMAFLMSTSASTILQDLGGMVRVFPILILQHPFLAFSLCRTTLSLPKIVWPRPIFRVTSWFSMKSSPRKAVCSPSSATTTVSRNSCPPTLSWTSTSPRVTNSEPSATIYVSITGLNSRCCLWAKDSYTDTSIMEVEAPESTIKVIGCSFTLVAIYHPACFWIVRTCAGLSELQAGTMAPCPALTGLTEQLSDYPSVNYPLHSSLSLPPCSCGSFWRYDLTGNMSNR